MFRYNCIISWQFIICMLLLIQWCSSAELRSFKEHYTDLLMNIHDPAELLKRLFSADLLSYHMIKALRSLKKPGEQIKVQKLLDIVEIQISIDPLKFDTFVTELRKDSQPMQHLCDKLRSTCGECDNVCLSTSTDQWCSGLAQLKSQHMDPFDEVVSSMTLPQSTSGEQRKCSW